MGYSQISAKKKYFCFSTEFDQVSMGDRFSAWSESLHRKEHTW